VKVRSLINSSACAWAILLFLWGVAGALAGRLVNHPLHANDHGGSVSARIFGKSARGLAEGAILQADKMYHGGRPHAVGVAFTGHQFQRLTHAIAPRGSVHLAGDDVKEIMFWMRAALALDPHNAENYSVAAYWMANEIERPDLGLAILQDAQLANPDSYVVQMEKGRFYAKGDKRDLATRAFDKAISLWPSDKDPSSKDAKVDVRDVLSHRAVLYELEGNIEGAVLLLKKIVELFPDTSDNIRERIAALEAGKQPPVEASRRWHLICRKTYHQFCEEATHAEHQHDEHCNH
jgi:tetratricopeptide (TPR) repeat protein